MKITFLVVVIVLIFVFAVSSQDSPIDKGSKLIGGQIFFQSQSGDLYEDFNGDALTTFGITPEFGVFVSPGFLVGGMLSFTSISQGDNTIKEFGIGPMITYYFTSSNTEVKGSTYPFVGAFGMYTNYSNGSDAKGYSLGAKAGIDYMISSAVALQAGAMFSFDSIDPDFGESYEGTTLTIGLGIESFVY